MYKLYVRRNCCEEWSAWIQTDSIETLASHIKVIESYGWQWSLGGYEQ